MDTATIVSVAIAAIAAGWMLGYAMGAAQTIKIFNQAVEHKIAVEKMKSETDE